MNGGVRLNMDYHRLFLKAHFQKHNKKRPYQNVTSVSLFLLALFTFLLHLGAIPRAVYNILKECPLFCTFYSENTLYLIPLIVFVP